MDDDVDDDAMSPAEDLARLRELAAAASRRATADPDTWGTDPEVFAQNYKQFRPADWHKLVTMASTYAGGGEHVVHDMVAIFFKEQGATPRSVFDQMRDLADAITEVTPPADLQPQQEQNERGGAAPAPAPPPAPPAPTAAEVLLAKLGRDPAYGPPTPAEELLGKLHDLADQVAEAIRTTARTPHDPDDWSFIVYRLRWDWKAFGNELLGIVDQLAEMTGVPPRKLYAEPLPPSELKAAVAEGTKVGTLARHMKAKVGKGYSRRTLARLLKEQQAQDGGGMAEGPS